MNSLILPGVPTTIFAPCTRIASSCGLAAAPPTHNAHAEFAIPASRRLHLIANSLVGATTIARTLPAPPTPIPTRARSVTRTPASSRSPWALDTTTSVPASARRQTLLSMPVKRSIRARERAPRRPTRTARRLPRACADPTSPSPSARSSPRARRLGTSSGRAAAATVSSLHRRVRASLDRDATLDATLDRERLPRAETHRRDDARRPRRRRRRREVSGPRARGRQKCIRRVRTQRRVPLFPTQGNKQKPNRRAMHPRHTRARDPIDRARAHGSE